MTMVMLPPPASKQITPENMPDDCQEWILAFMKVIKNDPISKICCDLSQLGVRQMAEPLEANLPETDPLGFTARNQTEWNRFVVSLIPKAMRRDMRAYFRRDLHSTNRNPENTNYGKNFLKSWSRWIIEQL